MKLADKMLAVTGIAAVVYIFLSNFLNQIWSAGIAAAAAVLTTMLYSEIKKK